MATTLSFGKLFEPNQVDNAAAETLYTVPAAPSTSLLRNGRVRFSNTTTGAVTIKAWAVPVSGAAADTNVILPTYSVPANSYIDLDLPLMKAGDFLQAQAGAATSISASLIDGVLYS